jgi:hypothetical protein
MISTLCRLVILLLNCVTLGFVIWQEQASRCLSVFSAYLCLTQVIRTTTAALILACHLPRIVFLIRIEWESWHSDIVEFRRKPWWMPQNLGTDHLATTFWWIGGSNCIQKTGVEKSADQYAVKKSDLRDSRRKGRSEKQNPSRLARIRASDRFQLCPKNHN